MQSEAKVYHNPVSVAQRLDELGLTEAVLREAVEYGIGFYLDCTEYDPPSGRGSIAWDKTTRGLRERLVPQKWEYSDAGNFSIVVNPKLGYAIAVNGGNSHTGNPDRTPSPRSERGPMWQNRVNLNNQYSFWHATEGSPEWPAPDTSRLEWRETYVLLFFVDLKAEQARAELSLPAEIAQDGSVSWWRERIILPPIEFGQRPTARRKDDDGGDGDGEIDIRIERRA
jgi:hypothetical protein